MSITVSMAGGNTNVQNMNPMAGQMQMNSLQMPGINSMCSEQVSPCSRDGHQLPGAFGIPFSGPGGTGAQRGMRQWSSRLLMVLWGVPCVLRGCRDVLGISRTSSPHGGSVCSHVSPGSCERLGWETGNGNGWIRDLSMRSSLARSRCLQLF